jgi:hypothetical protein
MNRLRRASTLLLGLRLSKRMSPSRPDLDSWRESSFGVAQAVHPFDLTSGRLTDVRSVAAR